MGDRYNSYRPPPPDSYRQPPRYDDRPPPPPPDGDMFHFRGAANRPRDNYGGDSYRPGGATQGGGGDNYRPGGNNRSQNDRSFDFNFQAGNGNAPSFAPTTDYPSARRGPRSQPSGRGRDRAQNTRGGRGGRGRGRPFVPRRAGDRELMRTERAPTPEQLEGMSVGQSRFKALEALDGLSESESEPMDLGSSDGEDAENKNVAKPVATNNDSDSEGEHPRAKRARIRSPEPAAEESKPKWSNPDPYWALPPPDESQTKKKDVVKLIRKAKVEAAQPETQSKAASDFISLNFDDDEVNDNPGSESGELSAGSEDDDVKIGQSNQTSEHRPSFSHLNNLHPDRIAAPASTAASQKVNMELPPGNLGVWPPPPPGNNAAVRGVYDEAVQKQDSADTTAKARQKNVLKGKKRKHPAHDLGDIVEEWTTPENSDPTPWFNLDATGWPSLHEEILDFYDYVRPRDFEEQVRLNLIQRIQRAIQLKFPQVQIKSFGSFASGLYLPTADMDLVAVSKDFVDRGWPRIATNNQMRKFAECLTTARIVRPGSLTVIFGARVPIIKLVDNETGLRVDVSFENSSGTDAQKTFEDWKQRYPAMPIIVALIKQFLVMRGMSEVFSGGLGGYSVICLVVSTICRLLKTKGEDWDQMAHLDHILMEFFIHFGEEFDCTKTGIQMEPWGYISKVCLPLTRAKCDLLTWEQAHWTPRGAKRSQPERLLIIDPNKYDNDISGGSKNVDIIFESFRRAYDTINASLDDVEAIFEREGERASILERIWGGNYGLFEIQRARLRALWDGQTRYGLQYPVQHNVPVVTPPNQTSWFPREPSTRSTSNYEPY